MHPCWIQVLISVKKPIKLCFPNFQDLEEQSRLIAASSRPGQPAADGQFLVLSNSQSEDSDAGEEGQKKSESEAWWKAFYEYHFLFFKGSPETIM